MLEFNGNTHLLYKYTKVQFVIQFMKVYNAEVRKYETSEKESAFVSILEFLHIPPVASTYEYSTSSIQEMSARSADILVQ